MDEIDISLDSSNFYENIYSEIYRSGFQGWGSRLIDKALLKVMSRMIPGRVLEIGGSSGEFLEFAYESLIFESWTILDPIAGTTSPGLASELESLGSISFRKGFVENAPFSDASFDTVVSTCVFAHVDAPEKALLEVRRLLNDGGFFVAAMPTDPGLLNTLVKYFVTYPAIRKRGINPRLLYASDVTPFFRSISYESRLAASVSWQEDCEHHDEKEEKAFA